MAEFLGIVKLGTFYHNGSALSLPIRPWYSGNYPDSLSARGNGDTPQFSGSMSDWVVGDTNSNEDKKLKWIKIKDGNRMLLICDRNILNSASWDTLNAAGYITGKKITIDGQEYLCRVLAGGDNYRSGSDNYSGGQPTNEWDRFVANEDNISGLPKPTTEDLDSTLNYEDLDRAHNQLWNWWGNYSWCKETYKGNSSARVVRGFSSARYFNNFNSNITISFVGWRPVLEVLNSAPLISDNNRDLGNYASALVKGYTVSDSDGDTVTVVEKLDGNVIRTLSGQPSGQSYTLDLTSKWSTLSLASHNIIIEATDSKGAKSTRTWTFTKTNSAPGAPNITTPANSMRVPQTFEVQFTTSTDAEGDTQNLKLQIADDSGFSQNVQTITAGLKRYNSTNHQWEDVSSVTNADNGKSFKFSATVSTINASKYIRVGSTDSGSNTITWSSSRQIKIGNVLEFQTLASATEFMPVRITIVDKTVIDSKATLKVFACNNAYDSSPTWEDITSQYKAKEVYEFTNKTKTADKWGVSVKYKIEANEATGEISVDAIGVGVN